MCCSSYKNQLLQKGGKNQAIVNAIIDFSNTSRAYKKYSVFYVSYYDTLYRKVHEKVSERNYQWIDGKPYDNIIAISIIGTEDKHQYLLTDSTGIGTKGHIPSKYIEKDTKLFIWKDIQTPLTEKTLTILKKYQLISTDFRGTITINELKKGTDYYFCRLDLTKYKKVITNSAIGFYDAPNFECD
jgi:hypothetical protein